MSPEVVAAVRAEASKRKIPLANALACVNVESNGELFAEVDGKQQPIIRWEGHYFDKRVKPTLRERARKLGLASPKVGGIPNPKLQSDRYKKLLWPAAEIDRQPAFASASYGAPQVMGANAQDLGYTSPEALFKRMCAGAEGQMEVMFRFIDHNGIVDELQRGDFLGFARVYNGPKTKGYDARMAKDAKRLASQYPDGALGTLNTGVPTSKPVEAEQASTMLRVGTSGAKVREAQTLLNRAANKFHYAVVKVDGDFGTSTYDAVVALQKAQGWRGKNVDGRIGPKTWAVLDSFRAEAAETPGAIGPIQAVTETPEGLQGAASAGGGVSLITAKETVQSATDQLYGSVGNGGLLDKVYMALIIAGVVLTVAGIGWAVYGWLKAKRTHGVTAQTVQ